MSARGSSEEKRCPRAWGDTVLTGCFGGLCTGAEIHLQHGLPVRTLDRTGWRGNLEIRSFNGSVRILGFHPETKEFLLDRVDARNQQERLERGSHLWVRLEDLVAMAAGKPVPSIANIPSGQELQARQLFVWTVEDSKYGRHRAYKAYYKGDPKEHSSLWDQKLIPMDPKRVLDLSCQGSLCSGDVVEYKDGSGGPFENALYTVIGFLNDKVYVQPATYFQRSRDIYEDVELWGDFASPHEISKVDLKSRPR